MKKTVVELFAGVGGFRVGLNKVQLIDGITTELGQWDFVWANQWEPGKTNQYAFDCYQKRFGVSENHVNKDIAQIDKKTLPDHDLLVGGFPCQDYSVARSLKGEKGIEGKKGVLFWDIISIAEVKKPSFLLLENVDRLLKSPSKQRGRDFGIMLRSLNDLGYNAEWRVINAADYGFAQRRRRVYIFAWKKTTKYNERVQGNSILFLSQLSLNASSFPIDSKSIDKVKYIDIDDSIYTDTVDMTSRFTFNFENCGCCINGRISTFHAESVGENPIPFIKIIDKNPIDKSLYLTPIQIEKFRYLKGKKRVERLRTDGNKYFFSEGGMDFPDNLEKPSRTMLTSERSINRSTHVIEDPVTMSLRFITPIEAERLQNFPDNWTNTGMPDKARYFMMGNALVTGVIQRYESQLCNIFDNEE